MSQHALRQPRWLLGLGEEGIGAQDGHQGGEGGGGDISSLHALGKPRWLAGFGDYKSQHALGGNKMADGAVEDYKSQHALG